MESRWRWCWPVFAVLCVGVAYFLWPDSPIEITRDPNPRFRIDPNQPYQIKFHDVSAGGSGGQRITISHDGSVKVARSKVARLQWEETTVTVPPEALAMVLELIESNKIMNLDARYEDTRVMGGGSSGVVINQGGRTKSVLSINHYPENWLQFENQLTQLVSEYTKDAVWRPLPTSPLN